MTDRVEVNLKSDGNLSHGGHSFTRFEDPRADGPEHLIADLHVDGTPDCSMRRLSSN